MYQAGDYVICRKGGVRQVVSFQDGVYILKEPVTFRTYEVGIADDEIVRRVISREALTEVISRIPYIPTIQAPNYQLRQELYDAAMAEFDEIEWVKVIKSVYLRGQEKRLMPSEEEYGWQAKKYLHGEIAAVLNIPTDGVEAYIAEVIAKDEW